MNESFHTHDLPPVDKDFCSCCRKRFFRAGENSAVSDNVVEILERPFQVLDWSGNVKGSVGERRPKAYYHAQCFQDHHMKVARKVECEKCSMFSSAGKLPDGRHIKDVCKCVCHSGRNYCSLLIL